MILADANPVNQDLHYSISSKKLDYNLNTGNVISISRLKDIIPAGYTGQIAQVNVPLDESLASALGLDDVRDLTPYTTHWVCPDGSCYYTRDRPDTLHYLSMTLWIENLGNKNLNNVIIARYEGSKYWNEDANRGVAIGVSSLLAITSMPEIATAAESAGVVAGGKAVIKYSLAPGGTLDFLLDLTDNIRAADNKVEAIKEGVKSIIKRYIGW